MKSKPPKEIRERRKQSKPNKQPKASPKKNWWLDPTNLGIGIAGLLLSAIGLILVLQAGLAVSLQPPLNQKDVLTTRFELANSGLLKLNNVNVTSFAIRVIDAGNSGFIEGAIMVNRIPPATLGIGDSETISFEKLWDVRPTQLAFCDVALIVTYRVAYFPFWQKRRAFRFITVRQPDMSLRLEKQPPGDALEQYDRALNRIIKNVPLQPH